MKGILGQKVGMTQVFTNHGVSIPVTVIKVHENIVTKVFTKEVDGYSSTQLGMIDVKKHLQKKPQIGHFKKAKTSPKKFVKEIRGMEGFELGSKVSPTIFKSGELVDVTGTSKGKGFAGSIKRHNQSIGPKSHGGGGGSQPVRQTGSLGDISGNKVVKGMTMPGQMGNVKRTQQNLEIVQVIESENVILIKGSIPGPRKSYVIIKEAVKGLSSKEVIELVNVQEVKIQNELLEEAKKVGADINTEMSIEEMKLAIKAANEAKAAKEKAEKAAKEAKKLEAEAKKVEEKAEELHEEAKHAKSEGNLEASKEAEEKANSLDKQAAVVETKAVEAKVEANEAKIDAEKKEVEAEKLQVESEEKDKEGDK